MDGEDFTARNEYYRKARICPHCGNDDKVAESEHPFGGVRVRRYVCLKCGWHWEVAAYREENEGVDAADEKFTLFPQLQKDDIVRYVSRLSGVEIIDVATYKHLDDYFYSIGEVVAIYRFDGRDFKCIWESMGYKLNRFEEAAAEVSTAIKNLRANVTSITAAVQLMVEHAKEAKEAGNGKQ